MKNVQKITKKAVMGAFRNVIAVGYCGADAMLTNYQHAFYTAGYYGWGANVYIIDRHTAIVTGYRPFGNVKPPAAVIEKYNKHAWDGDKNALEDFLKEILPK